MNGINGYQSYQDSFLQSVVYGRTDTGKTDAGKSGAEKTNARKSEKGMAETKDVYEKSGVTQTETGTQTVELSEAAQALLEKLQATYGNMDFIIADYSSEEEAQKYLSMGTKEYTVLIDPELLEEMAADEEVEKQYTDMIESATDTLSNITEELSKDGVAAKVGVSFDADGNMTYYAELEKMSEKQRERIEKTREEKKEKAEKEEKKEKEEKAEEARIEAAAEKRARTAYPTEMTQKTRVSADSAEELLEAIRGVDWSQVRTTQRITVGSVIDYGA